MKSEGSWSGIRVLRNYANICVADETTPLIVTRKAPGDDLDLASLQTALEEELIARERSRDPTRNNRHLQDKPRPRPTATALFSETQETAGGPASCYYCQQSHTSSECHVVKDLDARRQILMTNGRCFYCLAKGHVSRRCRSPPQCKACKRKHHPSICNQNAADPKNSSSLVEPTNVSTVTLNPEAPPFVLTPTTSALCSMSVRSVLLQTA